MKIEKKIIITGINGFVGRNIKFYLKNDYEIEGVSRIGKLGCLTYPQFFDENLTFDILIHLAGKSQDLADASNEADYYDANSELTRKLFNHFLHSSAKVFIFVSSVKVSADSFEGVLMEDDLPDPVSIYGKSKLLAERYILDNMPIDKKVYILRPCIIHGPCNKGNLNLLHGIVSRGFPYPLGAFENSRSFLYIENFCFVVKELLSQTNIPSGVYQVADDDPLSTNELIRLIAQSQNRVPKLLNISKKLIEGVAFLGDKLHLPLNSERLQKLTSSYVVSNAKIKAAIGKPLPVSSRDGLLKTFNSFNS